MFLIFIIRFPQRRLIIMLGNKSKTKFYRTGGTRGGQDQFKWDDVKTDQQRENYLGHSLNAPIGNYESMNYYNYHLHVIFLKVDGRKEKIFYGIPEIVQITQRNENLKCFLMKKNHLEITTKI